MHIDAKNWNLYNFDYIIDFSLPLTALKVGCVQVDA